MYISYIKEKGNEPSEVFQQSNKIFLSDYQQKKIVLGKLSIYVLKIN